jgi:NAD(P)-dependent dehydrogenase (short-subunit alcohol dehydrogenase family)
MTRPHVLVTGGGRGIGRAIALRFAREGAHVSVAARTSEELDHVVAEIVRLGGKGHAAQMDLRDYGSVEAAVWRSVDFLGGKLDVLVNNAGVFDVTPFEQLTPATWREQISVNLDGAFFVVKEAFDALRASGGAHLFHIASVAAKRGFAGNSAYCASKYGLRGFSDALREEFKSLGIRVSTVYPGATDTAIFDRVAGHWDRSKMNKPEDVAEVVWKAWSAPAGAAIDDLDVPPRA